MNMENRKKELQQILENYTKHAQIKKMQQENYIPIDIDDDGIDYLKLVKEGYEGKPGTEGITETIDRIINSYYIYKFYNGGQKTKCQMKTLQQLMLNQLLKIN